MTHKQNSRRLKIVTFTVPWVQVHNIFFGKRHCLHVGVWVAEYRKERNSFPVDEDGNQMLYDGDKCNLICLGHQSTASFSPTRCVRCVCVCVCMKNSLNVKRNATLESQQPPLAKIIYKSLNIRCICHKKVGNISIWQFIQYKNYSSVNNPAPPDTICLLFPFHTLLLFDHKLQRILSGFPATERRKMQRQHREVEGK